MNMLEKGLFHKNTPSVNPQSWTNVGGVLSALAARTTCQESSVVLIFRFTSPRENRFWGKWGKAGYRNGPELSRTISKLGTISNLAGTISFFREKWLELFQLFGKNGWNYFVFVWIFFRKMPWTISFVPANSGHFSIFLKTTPELSFPTAFHFLSSLPCPHMAQWAKKGKVTGGWQSWNWAVWRWNMATTLRGRTSLELPQETHENAEPCLVGPYGPRHQNRNAYICWFHLPSPANHQTGKGMESITKEQVEQGKMQGGTYKFALTSLLSVLPSCCFCNSFVCLSNII